MNFEQARQYAFTMPWKVSECFSGPNCWCRIVLPVEPVLYKVYDREEEYEIIRDGSIDKETAEYIVKLHNEHCERVKQSCREVLKELTDSMIPWTNEGITLTNDPTINDFRTIKRKEID